VTEIENASMTEMMMHQWNSWKLQQDVVG